VKKAPLRSDSISPALKVKIPYPYTPKADFVVGDPSGDGIRLFFYKSARPNELLAKVWFGKKCSGPPGHAHGGSIAAVLDEIMGGAGWYCGYPVVAGKIEVDFLKMVKLKETYILQGRIMRKEGRKVFIEGYLIDRLGHLFAKSKGIFIKIRPAVRRKLNLKKK
jgi:acyl-coenzyme A thioesterase PaaI-like protein